MLGEFAVQLEALALMEQKVHLARAQPVPRVRPVRLAALEYSAELERLVLLVQVLLGRSVG